MLINLPNILTIFRLMLIPFILLMFYLPFTWAPFCYSFIFMFAAITDWFDGFLARKLKQKTEFGKFLDPVADKIMITVTLILLTEYFHSWCITLPAVVVVIREITILALRAWIAEIGKKDKLSVLYVSKLKTAMQIFALSILTLRNSYIIHILGIVMLYISVIFTILSFFKYLNLIWQDIF